MLQGDEPGPLDRARRSRARTRTLLLRTTALTGVGVACFAALFGFRRLAPPSAVALRIEGDASDSSRHATPIVKLRGQRVFLDGVDVGTTEAIADGGQMQRLDGLFDALKRRRQERSPRERSATLDATRDIPAIVVKCVFQTLFLAGYPDVSFAVATDGAAQPAAPAPLRAP